MPITKSGRYSMNPAYAEALDAAIRDVENQKHQKAGHSQDGSSQDGSSQDGNSGEKNNQNNNAKDGDNLEKNGAQKKGAVKRIEIEPAENGGFVSRTHREQSEDGQNQHDGWAMPYEQPELRAHPDSAHLTRFLAHEIGD